MVGLNTLVNDVEVFGFFFDKDVIAVSVHAGDCGGSGAGAVVEDGLAFAGVGFYEILEEGDGFLGGV